jgi:hypothetical protein
MPVLDEEALERRPLLDFQAGYVERSVERFPKQGTRGPWTVAMSFKADRERLRKGPVEDPALHFTSSARRTHAGERARHAA